MSKTFRITLALLPLLTLIAGVQIGWRFSDTLTREWNVRFSPPPTTGSGGVALINPEREVDAGILWETWRILLARYIAPEKLTTMPMLFGAVRGLVAAVGDPYTSFLTPPENTSFREALQGELHGIGAELTQREGRTLVVTPLKRSPAERAGLLPGDVILSVDGTSVDNLSLSAIVARIRGEKGTKVTLTVQRGTETKEFTIMRDTIQMPTMEKEEIVRPEGTVAVIAINQFGDETVTEVTAAVKEVAASTAKGLILDVRHNGGGYLDGATALASLFLREGKIVTVKGRGDALSSHYATGRPLLPDLPLVVLVNQGSASAAEILAGALQDNKRATIIGVKSFGKGTVQEIIDLPGGSSLRVTTAHWLLPSGRNLAEEGIAPDITVELTPADADADRDSQRDRAVEFLLSPSPRG